MSNESTLQKVAEELTSRIGQITARYESDLAIIKAQAQEQIESLTERLSDLESQLATARAVVTEPELDSPDAD